MPTQSDLILNCFTDANPTEALRQFAIDLSASGLKKEEIYQIFLNAQLEKEQLGATGKADFLGDVMDMFTGWYKGRDIDL
jgi:hypothetical protein